MTFLVRRGMLIVALALAGVLFRYGVYALTTHSTAFADYVAAFCVWDCKNYDGIIEYGYDSEIGLRGQPDRSNWAFFPLYPILTGILVKLFGLTAPLAGFIFSNLATVVTAIASRPLFGDKTTAYWFFVFTLMLGPFSFLFSSLYTESLFVLLTALALVELQRSRYLAAAGWSALLSATRVTGVLMVFAILAQALVDHLRTGGTIRTFPERVLRDVNLLLAIFLAPLGLFAYMAFLHFHVGDALAFAHVQRGWERSLDNPLAALFSVFAGGSSIAYDTLLRHAWAGAGIIGLALTAVLAMRGKIAAAVFCLLCLLVSLASGIGSMVRFAAGLAPLGMVTAELLGRWKPLAYIAGAGAIALDAMFTIGWFNKSMFVM